MKSAVEEALQYLRLAIKAGELADESGYLPTAKELARSAGVSHVTMLKAVSILKEEGHVESRRGQRIRLVGARSQPADQTPESTQVQVANALRRDIFDGFFAPGQPLPQLKQLQARYGVCWKTMRRAIARLIRDRLLLPYGKGAAVAPIAPLISSACIMLVCPGHADGKLVPGVVGWEFLRSLSTECTRARIRLETVTWHLEQGTVIFMDSRGNKYQALPEFDSVHGFIHILLARHKVHTDVVRLLAQKQQPVVMFDQFGDTADIVKRATKRNMLILSSMVTESPGIAMARYLLARGHQRIAFISPFDKYTWSQKRFSGMIQEYKKAGHPDGVVLFAPADMTSPYDNIPKILKRCGMQPALRSLDKWLKHTDKVYAFEYRKRVPDAVEHVLTDGEMRRRLEPIFKKILADRSITAWAAANDVVAFYALDFLHEQGVGVPQQISVVGFDDLADALQYGLTTYNFNTAAIVSASLAHILKLPHAQLAPTKKGWHEIEGMVIERETTARARIM